MRDAGEGMARASNILTARSVATKPPGRHADGGGLYLLVRDNGARSWVFRYMLAGKRHDLGLGPAGTEPGAVTLADARKQVGDLRRHVRDGVDLAAARATARVTRRTPPAQPVGRSFRDVAKLYIEAHEAGWKSAKHAAQWTATLETYAFPVFGDLAVSDIVTGHVMDVLRPIWNEKPETATRLRGRIEAVLDYATPLEWRSGPNPARWKGHLASMLPARAKVAAVEHQPALPWTRMGDFMADLREREGVSALALQFAILAAARTGEVIGATWGEVDEVAKVWTIPALRMKAKREHRVPLTEAALTVLAKARAAAVETASDRPVFPGSDPKKGLSQMALAMLVRRMNEASDGGSSPWIDLDGREVVPHGFRSTFRDWASEATTFDRETAEAALAHTVKDKVEAAYRRGDQLEKRRRLMDAWAAFCAKPSKQSGEVIELAAMRAG